MPTAFGYIRVSSETQAKGGNGLDVQEQDVVAFYERQLKSEYAWGKVFADPAVSAKLNAFPERAAGSELLLTASRGDCIVFHRLDRAFRQIRDAVNTVDMLTKRGIKVIFLDMGGQALDMTTPMGKVWFWVMSMMAEMMVDQLQSRFREARAHLRSDGRAVNGGPGFCLAVWTVGSGPRKVRYVVPDIRKRRVCQFVHRSKRAGHGYQAIADYMNEHNLPVVVRGRTRWDAKCLENLHAQWVKRRERERAAGADGETTVLMPGGEVWPLDRFDPRVQARIKAEITLADKFWGQRQTEVDTGCGAG